MNLELLNHPNYQFQVMGEAAYSPDGIKKLEDLGATEVIVAFRNAYEGGPDERTLRWDDCRNKLVCRRGNQ